MIITFLRHNKLEKPFDDYNKLSYINLINLSNQTISPSISKEIKNTKYIKNILNQKFDKIYNSEQKRTIETVNLLWYNWKSIKLLNEIYFDIKEIITEDEYNKYWLKLIRKRLWDFIFLWKDWVESLNNLIKRIDLFINECKKSKYKNVLVVTHWFLLVLIKLRLEGIDFNNIDNCESLDLSPIEYLDWFNINY